MSAFSLDGEVENGCEGFSSLFGVVATQPKEEDDGTRTYTTPFVYALLGANIVVDMFGVFAFRIENLKAVTAYILMQLVVVGATLYEVKGFHVLLPAGKGAKGDFPVGHLVIAASSYRHLADSSSASIIANGRSSTTRSPNPADCQPASSGSSATTGTAAAAAACTGVAQYVCLSLYHLVVCSLHCSSLEPKLN